QVGAPDGVGILRIDGDHGEVPRPDAEVVAAVDQLPRVAAVAGVVQAALLGLDEGVDAAAVAGREGGAGAGPDARRQALALELLPGVAAVGRAVQTAAGAAAGEVPRPPPRLPQGGEQHARVVRVEGDIDGAGVGVLLEDLLPGLAAVG